MNLYIKKQTFGWQKITIKVGILLFLIVFLNIFPDQTRNYFYYISYPVSKIFFLKSKNIFYFFNYLIHLEEFSKENSSLREENQNLLSKIVLLEDRLEGDRSLGEVLEAVENDNFKIVLARVIGLNAVNDFLIVDRGFDDGIFEDMPVISRQKVLYGKVFKAYKNFSQIVLISNKNNIVNVKIEQNNPTDKPVYGAIRGSGNLSLYLDLVNADDEIKENEILVTSGLEGIFPRNLLVGEIKFVYRNDVKPFQTAQIHPFFDVKKIDNLFIITNYLEK